MIENIQTMLKNADDIDYREGLVAYARYHDTMRSFADHYNFSIQRVTAAFVSLSPNSDYKGNLRSLASVLNGIRRGKTVEEITVSTYSHCKRRAYQYAIGQAEFEKQTKGPKIKNFYFNIINPNDTRYVTIDGHMSAIWQGKNLTMRAALIRPRQYREIADACKILAFENLLLPNQLQAICWFARKRIFNSKYSAQQELFGAANDVWQTSHTPMTVRPYA